MAIGNPITLTDNVASKIVSTTATADQTLFTVSGGYRVNQIAVFRNGVRLVTGNDFIARDGSTVTLTTAANDGDSIEFQIFDDFRFPMPLLQQHQLKHYQVTLRQLAQYMVLLLVFSLVEHTLASLRLSTL